MSGVAASTALGTDEPRVNARDREILAFIGEQIVVNDNLLAVLRGGSIDANRRWRRRFRQLGYIKTETINGQVCTWLTTHGLRLCGLNFRYVRPSPTLVRHNVAIGFMRLCVDARMEQTGRTEYRWVSEREVAQAITEGEHMPDGEVHLPDGKVAIEVELTRKSERRCVAIMTELSHRYDSVWVWCAKEPKNVYSFYQHRVSIHRWDNIDLMDFEAALDGFDGGGIRV